jgi:hypothetical protein
VRRYIPGTGGGSSNGGGRRGSSSKRLTSLRLVGDELVLCQAGGTTSVYDRRSGACLAPAISTVGGLDAVAAWGHVLVLGMCCIIVLVLDWCIVSNQYHFQGFTFFFKAYVS